MVVDRGDGEINMDVKKQHRGMLQLACRVVPCGVGPFIPSAECVRRGTQKRTGRDVLVYQAEEFVVLPLIKVLQ